MKLSNKVLIAFFGFIFLYLSAVFAEIRFGGTSNIMDDKNSIAETVDLPGITYLILDGIDTEVRVIGSDHTRLELQSFSGGLLPKLDYTVSGDSLTLSDFQSEGVKRVKISVLVSKENFKGVIVHGARAVVKDIKQDFLHLSDSAGRITMLNSEITRLHLDLSNDSSLDITRSSIDTLTAEIEESEVHIYSSVGFMRGSIKNETFLQLHTIQEIQLKKDESSRLTMF